MATLLTVCCQALAAPLDGYDPGQDSSDAREFDPTTGVGRDQRSDWMRADERKTIRRKELEELDRRDADDTTGEADDVEQHSSAETRPAMRRAGSAGRSDDDLPDRKDERKGDGRYDGSQFDPVNFMDTDFRRKSYLDGFITRDGAILTLPDAVRTGDAIRKTPKNDDRVLSATGDVGLGNQGLDDADLSSGDAGDKAGVWRDLTTPDAGMLHDWVPDKVDRLQNGGFTTSPDNGAPVPYRLNGHVDIERSLPWRADD